ncbi:MAG: VOC family protein [Sedimentisphaerales bacterium]|jgi:methylmalonyl-CoA/ethylmalonyl-CoA epimerase
MRLHHIAYVCENVEQKADEFCRLLEYKIGSVPVIDESQGVRILFLVHKDGSRLELLEPYGPNSPVHKFLEKGGGLYHLCFEVDDLEEVLRRITSNNQAYIVKQPTAAPAIKGRRVAFVVTAEKDLIEFIEKC